MCDFASTDVPASPHLCLHLDIVIPLQLKIKMWEKKTHKFQELRGCQGHTFVRWYESCEVRDAVRAFHPQDVPFILKKVNLEHTHTHTHS